MTGRTTCCTPATIEGRKRKAEQFASAAEVVSALAEDEADVADAWVTLLIHAAIAASDVICCTHLGVHSQSENHAEAQRLLGQVDKALARDLGVLLREKTRAGYSELSVSADARKRVARATERLLDAMREL